MPHGMCWWRKQSKNVVNLLLKISQHKRHLQAIFSLYSVELNCIITEGASLDQKTASL